MVPLKKKWVWVSLALVIIVGIAGVAAAAGQATGRVTDTERAWRPAGRMGGVGPMGGRMGDFCGFGGFGGLGRFGGFGAGLIERLALTDEQIERIRETYTAAFKQTQALQASISEKALELQNLCWQRDPDKEAIAAKRDEIAALRRQMIEISEQMRKDLENILTEEQRKTLSELRGTVLGRRIRSKAGTQGKTPAAGAPGTTSN